MSVDAWEWRAGVSSALAIGGKCLETICYGPPPDNAPTLVMLHEGLGCVALWRDFPQKLADATGFGVIAYSLAGYGQSDSVALPRPLEIGKSPTNVDAVACASDDRERVCVFVVNSRREPVTLSLNLTELGAEYTPLRGETVRDTQDCRQPDVMNHWAAADRVSTVRLPIEGGKIVLPAYSASAIECGRR